MEPRYLNFPVSEIPYILTDRENAMGRIISYAVVSYARTKGITIKQAGKFLGVIPGDDIEDRARLCHNGSRSLTAIQKDSAFDFRDSRKSNFDTLCLVANLACHSIIGKHSYCLVRKDLIFSRMSGKDEKVPPRYYKPQVKKLYGESGRRRWNKVREVLESVYGLSIYAPLGTRGMYMSYNLSPEDLALSVESMKLRKRGKRVGNRSAALKESALLELQNRGFCTP